MQYNDLYTVELSSGDIEQITSVEGQYSSPAYSPDGKWIAYFGHLQESGPGSFSKLYRMPATGGATSVDQPRF